MAEQPELSFAGLLRQLRAEARLTQEELAEVARLSPRSVSDLERGVSRTAHKETALLLADALSLAEPVRALFVAAARGKAPAVEVLTATKGGPGAFAAAATRSLPRDIGSFTGRQAELEQLLGTLAAVAASGGVVGIHAINGMAGIGKTTFAVHAAHQLADEFPDGQFFLPLHAHTPGQRPVDPGDALASLLLTAGLAAPQIPPGQEARAARWRDHVAGKKILLLLDDAANHEQVRPLLPGTAGSLAMVTSRRRLTALEDATVLSLDTLPPAEAAALLARLADRPELGSGTGPAAEIAGLCGYLPLAIAMVASQLRHHAARTAVGIAAELTGARDRLELMRAENLSVAAAFGLSYADLTEGQQRLFRRLGLVPGPGIDANAAAVLDGISLDVARRRVDELYDQHLLIETAPGRYRLHDLIREHARALAADDHPADCDAAARRLLDYYAHTALAASWHIAAHTTADSPPPPGRPPAHIPQILTSRQAADWLETERANLHAATEYAASHAQSQHAIAIPAAISEFLRTRGYWDQSAVLHQTALAAARQAGNGPAQASALSQLGNLRILAGDHRGAAASYQQALSIYCENSDRRGQARAFNHLGIVQWLGGDYSAAAASEQQALGLSRDLGDRALEADALNDLGFVQQLTGDYRTAAANIRQALVIYQDLDHAWGRADALNHLGIVQRLTRDYAAAAASQQEALTVYREAEDRLGQAWALNELGLVQQLTGDYTAAAISHQQALEWFRDLGNRLGQAEALNNLGELATQTADSRQAFDHHTQALTIARNTDIPLEEARALEGIGLSQLRGGSPGKIPTCLRQALTIYQRIGNPGADRVLEILHDYGPASPAAKPKPADS